jgi:cysteinyl-tRNA synthetase
MVPIINSLKDKHIAVDAVAGVTWQWMQAQLLIYIEEVLGIRVESGTNRKQLNGVVHLLIEIRKEAKAKKDFATSDKIRNQLMGMGIQLKDEKDGEVSFTFS